VEGDFSSAVREVPVVAPARIWITSISSFENLTRGINDYSMDFSPCRQLKGYFIHMNSLSKKLLKKFKRGKKDCREYTTGGEVYRLCNKYLKVRVKAGSQIGTKGGFQSAGPLDFGLRDMRRTPIGFANLSRWENTLAPYTVCSFDYYREDLKSQLEGFLLDYTGQARTAEPRCGTIDQDLAETAQGLWYIGSSRSDLSEDRELALVHDNFDPRYAVFSVGTSLAASGLPSGTYYYDPNEGGLVNRDFSEISADGNVYCFETQDQQPTSSAPVSNTPAILVQLTSDSTLRIEPLGSDQCGEGPWSFGSGAVEFER